MRPKTKKTLNKTKKVIKRSKPSKKLNKPNYTNRTKNKGRSKITKIKMRNPLWPRQDESFLTLRELLNQGYDMVTFEAHPSACQKCKAMNGKTWRLQNFLDTTNYDAPIFSHSHVNAASAVRVWDSTDTLPDIYVDYTGMAF